jgi:hypothetical protein
MTAADRFRRSLLRPSTRNFYVPLRDEEVLVDTQPSMIIAVAQYFLKSKKETNPQRIGMNEGFEGVEGANNTDDLSSTASEQQQQQQQIEDVPGAYQYANGHDDEHDQSALKRVSPLPLKKNVSFSAFEADFSQSCLQPLADLTETIPTAASAKTIQVETTLHLGNGHKETLTANEIFRANIKVDEDDDDVRSHSSTSTTSQPLHLAIETNDSFEIARAKAFVASRDKNNDDDDASSVSVLDSVLDEDSSDASMTHDNALDKDESETSMDPLSAVQEQHPTAPTATATKRLNSLNTNDSDSSSSSSSSADNDEDKDEAVAKLKAEIAALQALIDGKQSQASMQEALDEITASSSTSTTASSSSSSSTKTNMIEFEKSMALDECFNMASTPPHVASQLRWADDLGRDLVETHDLSWHASDLQFVVLLLAPAQRQFEFLHLELAAAHDDTDPSSNNDDVTVEELLRQLPAMATNPTLAAQTYVSLCRSSSCNGARNKDAHVEFATTSFVSDSTVRHGDILWAAPQGHAPAELVREASLLARVIHKAVRRSLLSGRAVTRITTTKNSAEQQQRPVVRDDSEQDSEDEELITTGSMDGLVLNQVDDESSLHRTLDVEK